MFAILHIFYVRNTPLQERLGGGWERETESVCFLHSWHCHYHHDDHHHQYNNNNTTLDDGVHSTEESYWKKLEIDNTIDCLNETSIPEILSNTHTHTHTHTHTSNLVIYTHSPHHQTHTSMHTSIGLFHSHAYSHTHKISLSCLLTHLLTHQRGSPDAVWVDRLCTCRSNLSILHTPRFTKYSAYVYHPHPLPPPNTHIKQLGRTWVKRKRSKEVLLKC